jgi:thiamine-phosphate pyrophosphorylase
VRFDPAARLYLVSGAQVARGWLADLVQELVDAGVDLIQLREKDLEAGDVIRVAEAVLEACRGAGVPLIINDRPDVALALGASGVHVGQRDLPPEAARRVVPDGIVGLSTHAPDEIDSAVASAPPARPDYIAVGPVYATPTKPGRPAVGLDLVRHAARHAAGLPWFAIGGIHAGNLPDVVAAGARRIVVVRAITEAPDPPSATAQLKEILEAASDA